MTGLILIRWLSPSGKGKEKYSLWFSLLSVSVVNYP
jgi:hypothetical protein